MPLETVLSTRDTAQYDLAEYSRVYQACENCRRKKHKCVLGNPARPTPPCQACRRANLPCYLPERKRKGRPRKRFQHTSASNKCDAASPVEDGVGRQPHWQPNMGTFEPVVCATDETSPVASQSSLGHDQEESADYGRHIASRTLETFPLRNTSDAIKLLTHEEAKPCAGRPNNSSRHQDPPLDAVNTCPDSHTQRTFFLLQEGLISEVTLLGLFRFYLSAVHPMMPLIPYERIPISPEHILSMASREMHFMAAILVVASSLTGDLTLHSLLWSRVQSIFAEVAVLGTNASLEVIEGLILLSEYPPNMGHRTGLGCEDTMCWMTVGTAVRLGYLLGLEQLGMQAEDVDEKFAHSRDRGKVAWSYCFCLDRQISIRVGKTFWHRSPGMTYQHLHANAAEDFPEMRDIPGIQDDYAGYLQSLIQINQVLTNAHDLLYPSKSRSLALAKAEHYFKHIDEFTETLSAFRSRWQNRPWRTYPINECVWISFHHLRLYIYAFSLQAYMQRVSSGNGGNRPANYFPTGLMGTSDARFIVEAINAAADVLRLVIGRLQSPGALSYLPLRFFLYFSHAGVFLRKAAVIVPLPPSQKRTILRLVQALVKSMSTASSNPKHPGSRYSSALDKLLRRTVHERDLQSPARTRLPSPRADDNVTAPKTAMPVPRQAPDWNDLSALLGSHESAFVAERPLQDLAADLDAYFDGDLNDPGMELQRPHETCDVSAYQQDPFNSLFSNDDIWGSLVSTVLDEIPSLQDQMGTT